MCFCCIKRMHAALFYGQVNSEPASARSARTPWEWRFFGGLGVHTPSAKQRATNWTCKGTAPSRSAPAILSAAHGISVNATLTGREHSTACKRVQVPNSSECLFAQNKCATFARAASGRRDRAFVRSLGTAFLVRYVTQCVSCKGGNRVRHPAARREDERARESKGTIHLRMIPRVHRGRGNERDSQLKARTTYRTRDE